MTDTNLGHKFTSITGRAAAQKRWDKDRADLAADLIAYVSEELGHEATPEEALRLVLNLPLIEASKSGKTAPQKFLAQRLGLLPQPEITVQDNRKLTLNYNTYTFDTEDAMQAYIQDVAEHDPKLSEDIERQVQKQGSPPYQIEVEV